MALRQFTPQPFSTLMGVEVTEANRERVRARLKVRPDLCTSGRILHGGAIMAFADMMGATGAVFNLPDGAGTTTIESKTNFIGPAPEGTTVEAESTPLHVSRKDTTWNSIPRLRPSSRAAPPASAKRRRARSRSTASRSRCSICRRTRARRSRPKSAASSAK
jgi:1,4-dihydroxy-2-naphthoyl-CoA hydrolase